MIDTLLAHILMFACGMFVGRLFYKFNPIFMIIGIVFGGTLLASTVETGAFYSLAFFIGFFYCLWLIKQRNNPSYGLGGSSSIFGRIYEFIASRRTMSDAQKFRQQQEEENRAYDEFRNYQQRTRHENHESEKRAEQESAKARQQQEDLNKERAEFRKEKQRYEQGKENKQNTKPEEPLDTRSSHEILGVQPTATLAQIKQAYKRLSNKYHPDKNMHMSESFIVEAKKEFVKIQHAYEVLSGKKN